MLLGWDTNTDDGPLKRKIKKLEDNNKQLRDQLKVAYAEAYKNLCQERCSPSLLVQLEEVILP